MLFGNRVSVSAAMQGCKELPRYYLWLSQSIKAKAGATSAE
jgi:hypothetical protein